MLLGVFIESVLLRLNGGQLTDEGAIQRADIKAYVPAAVNWAMSKTYNLNLGQFGDRDYPSVFYASFNDLTISRATRIPTITLPFNVVPMYGNQGLRYIKDNCGHTYSPLSDSDIHTVEEYIKVMTDLKFYRLKAAKKVELYGLNPLITKLSGEYIIKIEDLTMEDELPLQAGTELEAIQVCMEFFTGQRSIPSDKLNNKTDINVA